MPRFRFGGRRFWSNRRRRRREFTEATPNHVEMQEDGPHSLAVQSDTVIHTAATTNDLSIQRTSTEPPISINTATSNLHITTEDVTTCPVAMDSTDSSTDTETATITPSRGTPSLPDRGGEAVGAPNCITETFSDIATPVRPSRGTTTMIPFNDDSISPPPPIRTIGTLTFVSSTTLAIPATDRQDDSIIQSSVAMERLPQRENTFSSDTTLNTARVVTVLLRESDGEAVYSRLLGTTVRPHLVHQPRRYHFIWSSDGTDSHLWSSPIRLRSYLSQFCTAMSRRVIPRGASIEVVLYPHLLANATPGFVPMSITRIYCMIHPIHPPTSWQTQFPTDFAGNWSSFISDLGINALAGPLLEAPIPTSLPDSLATRLLSPPPLTIEDRPLSTATDVTSLAPHIESPPLDEELSESTVSHISLPLSVVSSQSLQRASSSDADGSSHTNSSHSNNQLDISSPHSIEEEHETTRPFRFSDLPNRGCHDYNLFVPPSYVLGPIIGEGEFAKVRMACNLVTNGAVAIKSFRRRRGGLSSSIDEQILREVNVLKGLRCRNIVKVFESLVYGDRVFMVMEIMTKGDLRKYINKTGAMKESNARKMFADILNGVVYLHQHRIAHLDLKLENLLLNEESVIKITDFGCARIQVGQKRFNTPCGSYAYGAPEVISGQTYDGMKADIWSLGVILYCMVSARLPYADDGQLTELIWERREAPDVPSWVSPECCKLIRSSLRYKAERRINETQMMTHSWMWVESRRLPWTRLHLTTKG